MIRLGCYLLLIYRYLILEVVRHLQMVTVDPLLFVDCGVGADHLRLADLFDCFMDLSLLHFPVSQRELFSEKVGLDINLWLLRWVPVHSSLPVPIHQCIGLYGLFTVGHDSHHTLRLAETCVYIGGTPFIRYCANVSKVLPNCLPPHEFVNRHRIPNQKFDIRNSRIPIEICLQYDHGFK